MDITTIDFDKESINNLVNREKGTNWPVVYIIHNDDVVYVGETSNVMSRLSNHRRDPVRDGLDKVEIVEDDRFNKSVVLDFEQSLIRLYKVDGRFSVIQNLNDGQSASHEYYERLYYENLIPELWQRLKAKGLAKNDHSLIINSNLYKYSPYTSLNEEQMGVYKEVLNDIYIHLKDYESLESEETRNFIITGGAGTGKTVLAISLLRTLSSLGKVNIEELIIDTNPDVATMNHFSMYVRNTKKLKVALCISMESLRDTLREVVEKSGLGKGLVLGPNDIARGKDKYDVVIIDESHRMKRRKNLGHNFGSFDDVSEYLELDSKECTQLDWIEKRSKYCVLFYDEQQSVKGCDITREQFNESVKNSITRILTTQMRCRGGKTFTDYINDILDCRMPSKESFSDIFQFRIYDDVQQMVDLIKLKDSTEKLCRVVAGYSWKWVTKGKDLKQIQDEGLYDIDIEGHKFIWNTETNGWILSKNAINEIGSIHTTQGFDLNYVGVIFGPEIDYDSDSNEITIDRTKFFDRNVSAGADDEQLKEYILNSYKVMMARGIKGCYVYACNPSLREYFHKYID